MRKYVLIEEFHLNVSVPRDLSDAKATRVRRVLGSARFQGAVKRALRQVVRGYRSLRPVRVHLTR